MLVNRNSKFFESESSPTTSSSSNTIRKLSEDVNQTIDTSLLKKKFVTNYPNLSEDSLKRLIENFSEKDRFTRDVLDLDWDKLLQLWDKEEKVERGSHLSSTQLEALEFEALVGEIEDEIVILKRFDSEYDQIKEIPIKLIITETEVSPTMRKFLSPMLYALGFSPPTFGMFHVGIVCASWILEWNDSSLCMPRKCGSNHSLLTADIGFTIQTRKQLKEVYSKISQVIIDWNTSYTYTSVTQKHPKESKSGNCQNFVDELLDALEIKMEFPPCLAEYIAKMRKDGKGELIFETNDAQLIQKSMIRRKTKFATHQELDKFVLEMITKNGFISVNQFKEKYPGEIALLKSFDRAFWLRHLRDLDKSKSNKNHKVESKYECLKNEKGEHICPFDDPRKTYSLMENMRY